MLTAAISGMWAKLVVWSWVDVEAVTDLSLYWWIVSDTKGEQGRVLFMSVFPLFCTYPPVVLKHFEHTAAFVLIWTIMVTCFSWVLVVNRPSLFSVGAGQTSAIFDCASLLPSNHDLYLKLVSVYFLNIWCVVNFWGLITRPSVQFRIRYVVN